MSMWPFDRSKEVYRVISIVEDDISMLAFYEKIFMQIFDGKCEILKFSTRHAFLEHLESREYKKPDFVICDVKLPDGNGFKLSENVSEFEDDFPIIYVTGLSADQIKTKDKGHLIINKPVDSVKLATILKLAGVK